MNVFTFQKKENFFPYAKWLTRAEKIVHFFVCPFVIYFINEFIIWSVWTMAIRSMCLLCGF